MVYTIMMQGGCWFIYLLLGRGDEHVYVYVCPRGGYTPQVGREGAVLVVFVLFFLVVMFGYTIPVESMGCY